MVGDTVRIVLNTLSNEEKTEFRGKTANIVNLKYEGYEGTYRILLDISNDWLFSEDELDIYLNLIDIEI